MFRDDYLMRMIKQIAHAIARMMKLRKAGEYAAAFDQADQLYEQLGISRELVDVVDTPTLAGMLRDPDRMRAAGQLLYEEGLLYKAKGDPLTAFARHRRAHELYLEAHAVAPADDDMTVMLELSRLAPAQLLDERYRR